ncbi:unnamed protein product [Rotaria sordida]|uniref:Uncharacterized protein n=1 Tax=Rotaria sordida TaxID=392033 RepID=A0A813N0I1_9BILA|nr:unnamed protein product [Rotaria sordida]
MAKYWWYFYNTEYSKVNKNEKYESDYLENHRNTSLAITKCELQIGETLSKLYSTISKIKRLSKHSTLDITFIGDLITNIDLLPSAENIPENTPRQRAMDIYTNNKAILYQTYLTQISRLDTLLDELRT